DDRSQAERIIVLNSLIDSKLGELSKTIELFQAGQTDDARALVLTNLGKQTMDHIRSIMEEMWNAEVSRDEQRTAEYLISARRTVWSIYLATFVAVLAIGTVAYLVWRDIQKADRYTQEIKQREEWFRVTLNSIGDGVIATDPDGNITFMNAVAEDIT